MGNDVEDAESYYSLEKEDETYVARLKGPRPTSKVNDCILGASAGGFSAMAAFALAGVNGERFGYITLIVAGIAGVLTFFARQSQHKAWQAARQKRMEKTAPQG